MKNTVANSESKNVKLGIILALLTIFIFALQDVFTKYLAARYPIAFFVTIRYWAFALFVIVFLYAKGELRRSVKSNTPKLQFARSALLVFQIGIFALGLRYMKLADAHSLFAAFPLFVTLLSVPFLGEHVGWRRYVAVAVGFIGVLIIIKPGIGVFQVAALIPLTAAIGFAFYTIMTRMVSLYDNAYTTLLYTAVIGAIIMTFIGPFYWTTLTLHDSLWILALCITGSVSHILLIKALELV